ncbi:MAG TPA: M55 family metallopeptidase [Myxococcaceae bacterium]|nr:M55 family metallopeptidase [Myxococcaceae bacterium]
MKVYISVDMEGIAGVVHVDQTRRGGGDYERARRWMTAEANAAIIGAYEAGAEKVLVNDSHGDMRNLLLEELDPRAEIISGSLKPMSMVQGAGAEFGVALFVGYHAGAGSRAGILDHTYHGRVVAHCRVGGREFDELAINAAVCGTHGVPVGLVTGDSTICGRARTLLGDVETVEVKEAITRYAARCLSPAVACQRIQHAARQAVRRAADKAFAPYRLQGPLELEVAFTNSACADAAELLPDTVRRDGVTCVYTAPDAVTLLRVFRAWIMLAAYTLV